MYHVWIRIPKLTIMQMQMVQNGDEKCSKSEKEQMLNATITRVDDLEQMSIYMNVV